MSITAILAGTILTPTDEIEDGVVVIEDGHFAEVGRRDSVKIPVGAQVVDHSDQIVAPGFVDTHTHGAAGHDFMEATPEALSAIGSYFARHGTTSYLATTITADIERTVRVAQGLGKIVRAAADFEDSLKLFERPAAQPLGIYFEGPFLNVKRRGAHPAADIQEPSVETFAKFLDAADGAARSIAMAPELPGALAALAYGLTRGVRIGIGHSDATYEEALRAIDAGATYAVHIYNAMRPFSHRDPGIIAATLTDDRVFAELICDGIHVEPAAVRLLTRAKGLGRIVLVTDSVSATGMPDGDYRLGQFDITIKGGVCRTAEGTLAGSSIALEQALRNFVNFTGLVSRIASPVRR